MALIETESLVLRSYNLADADKIVIFLTISEGLVRGVAKGAKRLKSKFGSTLEPFSIVNITFFQKEQRELVAIRDIELKKSFFNDAGNIRFLQKFAYLADLLIEFAPPHDPNDRLYKMSKVCLETASLNPMNLDAVVLYFELWILKLGGYLPSWDICNSCKRDFTTEESAILQLDFHLFCNNCQNSQQKFPINSIQRKIFTLAQKVSPQKFIDITADSLADVLEVSTVLKKIISNILGKEIIGKKTFSAQY